MNKWSRMIVYVSRGKGQVCDPEPCLCFVEKIPHLVLKALIILTSLWSVIVT